MKGLEQIEFTLNTHTAFSFAQYKLHALKTERDDYHKDRVDYHEYMRDCFSGKDNPTLEECEQNAFCQFLYEYKKCIGIYLGWLENGKVFILDRTDKIVLALYKKDESYHSAITHYNPLNRDLIEWSMSNKYFFQEVEKGRFDMSIDETLIINECDALINPHQP